MATHSPSPSQSQLHYTEYSKIRLIVKVATALAEGDYCIVNVFPKIRSINFNPQQQTLPL
jgi:hypothetical protein